MTQKVPSNSCFRVHRSRVLQRGQAEGSPPGPRPPPRFSVRAESATQTVGRWSAKHSLWLLTETAWRPLVCTRAANRAGTSGWPGRVLSLPSRPASWWRRSYQDERERLTLTAASSVEAPATLVTKGSQTLCLSSTYSLHPPMSSQNAEL